MRRINISRLGTDEQEAEAQIQLALQQGQQHTVLTRLRLRRGGQSKVVRSLLFIPPHRSTGVHKALGQVCPPPQRRLHMRSRADFQRLLLKQFTVLVIHCKGVMKLNMPVR